MGRRLRTLSHLLLVLAMFAGAGGHWLLLQSVAWGGMLLKYSQEGPIGEAISKTFDGEHPCSLCKVVERESRPEKTTGGIPTTERLFVFLEVRTGFIPVPQTCWPVGIEPETFPVRAQEPLLPPPRMDLLA